LEYWNIRKKKLQGALRTHNLDDLKLLAGMESEISSNSGVLANWSVATEWRPELRYEAKGTTDRAAAEKMLEAVKAKPDGVLECISKRW
jgi:hypothetical protein